jgi:hypothetical protein
MKSLITPSHLTSRPRFGGWTLPLAAASFAAAVTCQAAPILMSGSGGYLDSFDSLPTAPTAANVGTPWTNDSTLTGWYAEQSGAAALANILAGNGSATAGGFYSYGTAATTERAIGSLGSGTPANIAYGVLLQNTSGGSLVIDLVSFTGEQWRNGGNAAAHKLTCSYKKSSTAITLLEPANALPAGWTSLASADFTGPIATATATALDGNLPANRAAVSTNPGISVAAGEYVFLRWHDLNDSGNDHGLALDDLEISWEPSVLPSITVTATLDTFSESAAAPASVGTVTIPLALATDLEVALVSSDITEATVPATVTILANQTSANFDITAVNDFLADGNQGVTVTATAAGYLSGQKNFTVEEDSDVAISVLVDPIIFAETAGPTAAAGTITIAQNTLTDLTITLNSTDITEATVPATVTILANTNSIGFSVAAQDDSEVDGTRNLFIQASAPGYTSGSAQIQVTDFGDTAPAPTLPVDAIAFTGYNAESNDDLAFVALVPIAAGDVILFTDNEWNGGPVGSGGGFVDTNEGVLTWTAPAEGVAAGTIVTIDGISQTSWTASVGSITGSSFALALAGDTVYAIQGAVLSTTRVLAAISTNTDTITGTGLSDYVLLPTGVDIGAYNGLRNNQAAYASYVAQVNDEATNWITQDTGSDDSNDASEPNVPFSTVAFTLGTPANTFASWMATYDFSGFTSPDLTATGDPDNDGLDNALENIFGTSPAAFSQGLSAVSTGTGTLIFRHTRNATPASDLTQSYEWSPDLVNWYASDASAGGVTVSFGTPSVVAAGPPELVEVTASITGTAPNLFARIKVQ